METKNALPRKGHDSLSMMQSVVQEMDRSNRGTETVAYNVSY